PTLFRSPWWTDRAFCIRRRKENLDPWRAGSGIRVGWPIRRRYEETLELGIATSTASLGNIRRNRSRTSSNLAGDATDLLSRKLRPTSITGQRKCMRLLPNHQIPKILHGDLQRRHTEKNPKGPNAEC